VELTARGEAQARAAGRLVGARFAPVAVVASPLRRALRTAELIAAELGLDVAIEPELRERSYGAFAGRPYADARPGFDPAAWGDWRPPGGESLVEVAVRVGAALDRVAARHAGADVVVVSHGGVMLALARHVTGDWGAGRVARNAEILVATHRAGAWDGLAAVAETESA
jgi:probable phosphoglycerate mutase